MSNPRTPHVTTTDGVAVGGTVHGQGPPLVVLQGAVGGGDIDRNRVVGHLSGRVTGHLPSLPGPGLSGAHPDLSPGRQADDLRASIDSIGEPIGLVGRAGGANKALAVAAQSDAGAAGRGLRLELLGGVRVSRAGAPLAGLRSRKAAALLAYLAVTGRPQRREALAGLLWDGWPAAAAQANLRQALAGLRRLVGDALQTTHGTAGLSRAGAWTDAAAFEALLAGPAPGTWPAPAGGGPERLRAAVALYAGDFLAGFGVPDAPPFDEWATVERERLRRLAVGALRRLAAATPRGGRRTRPPPPCGGRWSSSRGWRRRTAS